MKRIKDLKPGRFLVIGDLMVDEYNLGTVTRISPEAPIPIIEFKNKSRTPGGAANVAMNLAGLGNLVEVVGLIGEDESGTWLRDYLISHGIGVTGIRSDPTRPTTNKVRFGTSQQSMIRVDYEDTSQVDGSLAKEMAAYIEQFLCKHQVDGVLISDYNKGMLRDENTSNPLLPLLNKIPQLPLICGADTKKRDTDLVLFADFHFIKPNRLELAKAVKMSSLTTTLSLACEKYLAISKAKSILVTLGAEGMYYYDGAREIHVPAVQTSAQDVTGAGDTVFAVVMQSLVNGLSWLETMCLANTAAAVVIESQGTKAISLEELTRRVVFVENSQPDYFVTEPGPANH